MELNSEQIKELSEFYWETDISTSELQKHFGLPKPAHRYIVPFVTDVECPNCSEKLVYKSRSSRNSDEKICPNCGHKDRSIYLCQCSYCQSIKEEESRRRREEQEKREAEALKARIEETSSPEYVSWAISKLSRREKIFLQSFLEILQEKDSPTWQDVCDRAKVVSHKKYVDKLLKVCLLRSNCAIRRQIVLETRCATLFYGYQSGEIQRATTQLKIEPDTDGVRQDFAKPAGQ
jgi:hypothetical protein